MTKKKHYEHHTKGLGANLEEFVYGAIDGTVTTFAVVAGVVGAQLAPGIVLILGFANLFADGFSMAASDFLSKRANKQFIERERERETWEVEHVPEEERDEIKKIYRKKGFTGKLLNNVVKVITSNKKRWVDVMMKEELGLLDGHKSALKSAILTFIAFLSIGFIPLFAYVMSYFNTFFASHTFLIASILTGATFLFIGFAKAEIVKKPLWKSGIETLLVGGAAAAISYLVGVLLRWLA